jgi:hypothetical protein
MEETDFSEKFLWIYQIIRRHILSEYLVLGNLSAVSLICRPEAYGVPKLNSIGNMALYPGPSGSEGHTAGQRWTAESSISISPPGTERYIDRRHACREGCRIFGRSLNRNKRFEISVSCDVTRPHDVICQTTTIGLISLWLYIDNNKLQDWKKCIYSTYSTSELHTLMTSLF